MKTDAKKRELREQRKQIAQLKRALSRTSRMIETITFAACVEIVCDGSEECNHEVGHCVYVDADDVRKAVKKVRSW